MSTFISLHRIKKIQLGPLNATTKVPYKENSNASTIVFVDEDGHHTGITVHGLGDDRAQALLDFAAGDSDA